MEVRKLFIICLIFSSYTIIEVLLRKSDVSFIRNKRLWETQGYYMWGLVLMLSYYIVPSQQLFIKSPINNFGAIIFTIVYIAYLVVIFFYNKESYYPKQKKTMKSVHYCIIQPIFEEIAFRGIILPLTDILLCINSINIIILNAILFTLFHINYWSISSKNLKRFNQFYFYGLIFGGIALYTKSIFYSLIWHIMLNGGYTLYMRKISEKIKL